MEVFRNTIKGLRHIGRVLTALDTGSHNIYLCYVLKTGGIRNRFQQIS